MARDYNIEIGVTTQSKNIKQRTDLYILETK